MTSNKCGFLPHRQRSHGAGQYRVWSALMDRMLKRIHGKKRQYNGGGD